MASWTRIVRIELIHVFNFDTHQQKQANLGSNPFSEPRFAFDVWKPLV